MIIENSLELAISSQGSIVRLHPGKNCLLKENTENVPLPCSFLLLESIYLHFRNLKQSGAIRAFSVILGPIEATSV